LCTNTQTNVTNCGTCGNQCPATYVCLQGGCVTSTTAVCTATFGSPAVPTGCGTCVQNSQDCPASTASAPYPASCTTYYPNVTGTCTLQEGTQTSSVGCDTRYRCCLPAKTINGTFTTSVRYDNSTGVCIAY
jgi:hypothetical protein